MKQTTQEKGAFGEYKATLYLKEKGYHIRERNWRFKRNEIDIIAGYKDMLIFIEVKTRSYNEDTKPEAAVSFSQWDNIARAAGVYMARINHNWEVRFDIIAVTLLNDGNYEIKHFEDIFFPGR